MLPDETLAELDKRFGNRFRELHETARLVYKNPKEIALKSAEVVVVCQRTGQVLYEGSANDEG